jgi:hypothetical protein
MSSDLISVRTDAKLLAFVLGDVAGEQIPFATARALTDVAFRTAKVEKSALAHALELRNRFSASGIQVNPAEKGPLEGIYAEVGIDERRSYLIDHVLGGKRQGGSHGRAILEQESLRSGSGKVPAGKRPAALIAKAKRAKRQADLVKTFGGRGGRDKNLPFLFYSRKWGNEVLAQRQAGDRYPLRIVYAFRKGVSIKREFEMELIAAREVGLTYGPAFERALRRAIASGKGKAERQASSSRGTEIDTGR